MGGGGGGRGIKVNSKSKGARSLMGDGEVGVRVPSCLGPNLLLSLPLTFSDVNQVPICC